MTNPKVTPQDVEDSIAEEYYFTAYQGAFGSYPHYLSILINELKKTPGGLEALRRWDDARKVEELHNSSAALKLLTFCVLVAKNGHTVVGEAYCANPETFDAQTGRDWARKKAIDNLYPMVVYAARG